MSRYRLDLFGAFRLLGPSGEISVPGQKLKAFVLYLALSADRNVSREHLAALFWPDRADRQARQNLRKTLLRLRRLFASAGLKALSTDHEIVGLSSRDLEIDALSFRRLASRGGAGSAVQAAGLYTGELLSDLTGVGEQFDDWLIAERSTFSELALQVHRAAAKHLEDAGALQDAISTLDRALEIDPLQEDLQRRRMRVLTLVGQPVAALKRFERLAALLQEELGVSPEEETVALYHGVLADLAKTRAEVKAIWTTRRPGIVVVPLRNLSGEPELTDLANIIAETVVEKLTRFRLLSVIDTGTVSFGAEDSGLIAAGGRRWTSRYALRGTTSARAGKIHIAARLIDVRSGLHVWADHEVCDREELFDGAGSSIDRIVAAATEAIRVADRQDLIGRKDGEFDAWDNFQRGLQHFLNYSPEDKIAGRIALKSAIEQDPGLAPAYAYLAFSHLSAAKMSDSSWLSNGDVRAAHALARKAVFLDDRSEDGAAAYALTSSWLGHHDEAIRFGRRAAELNPLQGRIVYAYAMTLFYAGAYDAAAPILERIVELNPEDPFQWLFYEGLAEARYGSKQYTSAADAARQSLALKDGMIPARLLLSAASARLGMRDVAHDTIAGTSRQPGDLAARVFAHLRDKDAFFRRMREDLRQADIPM